MIYPKIWTTMLHFKAININKWFSIEKLKKIKEIWNIARFSLVLNILDIYQ